MTTHDAINCNLQAAIDSVAALPEGGEVRLRPGNTIPYGRPDSEYDLRGPDINIIHNPFPASITGIPGHKVENVTLANIDIAYPGRGTKGMGYIGAYRYKDIPEQTNA